MLQKADQPDLLLPVVVPTQHGSLALENRTLKHGRALRIPVNGICCGEKA
jgi:hypothetical protein